MDRAVERGQSFLDDEAERMLTGSAWRATDDDPASLAWPDPQPMAAKVEPKPYPLDALPATILAAVEEVAGFVKAPVPMVVSSALGALSLACQAHVDVKRAEKLTGPVGLFLLTLGDSGLPGRASRSDEAGGRALRGRY
jgi:hypothetical protein